MWWTDIASIESEALRVHLLFTPVKLSVHVARSKDYMSIRSNMWCVKFIQYNYSDEYEDVSLEPTGYMELLIALPAWGPRGRSRTTFVLW